MDCKVGIRVLFFCLLLGMNLFLLCCLHVTNNKYTLEKNQSTKLLDRLSTENLILSNDLIMIKQNNSILDSHLQLFSLKGDSISLSQIKKKDYTLVFRYSTLCCMACVDDILEILKNYAKDNVDVEILLLTTYHLRMDYQTFRLVSSKFSNVYNVESLNIPIEDEAVPYLFILDKDLRVVDMFIPRRELPNLIEQYLEKEKSLLTSY